MPTKLLNNIVLTEFLELVLGSVLERISISPSLAKQIATVDSDEQYTHIEWPNDDNKLERPYLWRIDEWRTSYKRDTQRRELSARERTAHVHVSELRAAMTTKIQSMTGLDANAAQEIAAQFIRTRNPQAAALFGIDIQPILRAEQELEDYKQLIGKK